MSEQHIEIGYELDPGDPGRPRVPATYTADDDVNPACGHHKRAQCLACGACVPCDACYCGEE